MPYGDISTTAPDVMVASTGLGLPTTGTGRSFLDFKKNVNDAVGNRYDDLTYYKFYSWINTAYRMLATMVEMRMLKGSFSFTVASGDRIIKLPSTVRRVDNLMVQEDPLSTTVNSYDTELSFLEVDTYRKKLETKGAPLYYVLQGDRMAIHPVPDKALTVVVDGYFLPEPLALDTDCSVYGQEWDNIVELLAIENALTSHREYDEAGQVHNLMTAQLRAKKDFPSEQRAMGVAAFRPARRRCGTGKRPGDY